MNPIEEQKLFREFARTLKPLDHRATLEEAEKCGRKFTRHELYGIMHEYNCMHEKEVNRPNYPLIAAVIVYKQENFNQVYPVKSRSYLVFSDSKYFCWWMGGSSLPGYCLDGTDQGVRLEAYKWEAEYCYFVEGQGL